MSDRGSCLLGRLRTHGPVVVLMCLGAACVWTPTAVAELQFAEVESYYASGWETNAYSGLGVATDGQGRWVVVWNSTAERSTYSDILSVTSDNDGVSWTSPAVLSGHVPGDSGWDVRPSIAYAGDNVWMVAWESNNVAGLQLGTDYDVVCAQSLDNGTTWQPPRPVNPNAATDGSKFDDILVRLSSDGAGRCVARWRRYGTGPGAELGARFGFSPDAGINWSEQSSAVTVLFPDNTVFYGQGQWLATDRDTDAAGAINQIVLWASSDGTTWPTKYTVASGETSLARAPVLASLDDTGRWLMLYQGRSSTGRSVVKARLSYDNGASWTDGAPLYPPVYDPTHFDTHISVATDGRGGCLAAWSVSGGLPDGTGIPRLGDDWDVVFSASTDYGHTWTPPVPVNADAATDIYADSYPQVAFGQDGWVVAWHRADTVTGEDAVHIARASASPPVPGPRIVVLPEVGLCTTEASGTAHIAVKLGTAPAADVIVTVTSLVASEGVATPAALTFTSDNWNVARSTTLTGVDDRAADGDQTYVVELVASDAESGLASGYNGVSRRVSVVNRDNDALLVKSIAYALVQRNLKVTLTVVNGLGEPVGGATVKATLKRDGVVDTTFTGQTQANGTVVFTRPSVKSGKYTTVVTDVLPPSSLAWMVWNGVYPTNSYTK